MLNSGKLARYWVGKQVLLAGAEGFIKSHLVVEGLSAALKETA